MSSSDELLEVVSVKARIEPIVIAGIRSDIPVIICELSDGREFVLAHVSWDIAREIMRIQGDEIGDDRETIYEILFSMPGVIDEIKRNLRRVIIDHLNPETLVYSAYAEFGFDNITIRRKMIPSHAIMLALLADRPIYVKKALVDERESLEEEYRRYSGDAIEDDIDSF